MSQKNLHKIIGEQSWISLKKQGYLADDIETYYSRKIEGKFRKTVRKYVDDITRGIPPDPKDLDWLKQILQEHCLETLISSYELAESDKELEQKPRILFSKPKKPFIPRNLKDLMKLWDRYRKKKQILKRADGLFEEVKKKYIKKVQDIWRKHGEDFRNGKTASKEEAVKAITSQSDATVARAKTIIRTETTYYNNRARKEIYDDLHSVTHYLFLAIRDSATTPWCKTRTGVVFKKDTELCNHNTPPCHWNCRSEMVPLTPFNPKHKKLIEDSSKAASNRSLAPLPPGWVSRK